MRNIYILVSYFREKLCHFQPYAVIFTLSSTPILIRNLSMHPLFVICRIYTEHQWKVTTASRTLNAGAHLDLSGQRNAVCSAFIFVACVCVFGSNVAFNNFSVISRRCLVATGSSMLTFIVLPHWSIMSQTPDMIPHPVTLSWHWVD